MLRGTITNACVLSVPVLLMSSKFPQYHNTGCMWQDGYFWGTYGYITATKQRPFLSATLLREAWGIEVSHPCCSGSHCQTCQIPVTTISLWVQCFSTLVAGLAPKNPKWVSDFVAYHKSIARASHHFKGAACVIYNRCYQRHIYNRCYQRQAMACSWVHTPLWKKG